MKNILFENTVTIKANPLQWLLMLSFFCCCIETIRMVFTGSLTYIFLVFNLLLAWVPFVFALLANKETSTIKRILYFLGWLTFFPNAPYIITDLVQLKERNNIPLCLDSILIYSFAFTGFLAGIFSALLTYRRMLRVFKPFTAKAFIFLAMLLSGYAIYMGRVLRWNSWDIILHPFDIASDTLSRIIHPMHHPQTYAVSISTGLLLCLSFLLFETFTITDKNLPSSPKCLS